MSCRGYAAGGMLPALSHLPHLPHFPQVEIPAILTDPAPKELAPYLEPDTPGTQPITEAEVEVDAAPEVAPPPTPAVPEPLAGPNVMKVRWRLCGHVSVGRAGVEFGVGLTHTVAAGLEWLGATQGAVCRLLLRSTHHFFPC